MEVSTTGSPPTNAGLGQWGHGPLLTVQKQWFDAYHRMSSTMWRRLEAAPSILNPHELRSRWLADMKQITAEYLRSSSFIGLMRFHLAALTCSARLTSPWRF